MDVGVIAGDVVAELAGETPGQAAATLRPAHVVGAGPPGDRQEPGEERRLEAVRAQVFHRAEERLLREVFGVAGVTQRPAEAPHRGLGPADDLAERSVVAVLRRLDELTEGIRDRCRSQDRAAHAERRYRGTIRPSPTTCLSVTCTSWREAISAIVDGEEPPIERRLVDAHVARCAPCAIFRENSHRLARHTSLVEAAEIPDLSGRVVTAARVADRLSVWWVLRLGLVVVAVQIAAFAAPALFFGESGDAGRHTARHLGSFALAYAIGLVVVAWRPAKARGLLPVAAALAGCLLVTAIVDVARGQSPLIAEVAHLPELLGLVLVWLLAAPSLSRPLPGRGERPPLRVVEPGEPDGHRRSGTATGR